MGAVGLLVLAPFLAMVSMALVKAYGLPPVWPDLTLEHFAFVIGRLEPFKRAVLHSLWLAGSAALATVALALVIGYGVVRAERAGGLGGLAWRWIRVVVALPGVVPGMVFSLGVLLAWLRPPVPGVHLYGTLGLLQLAYLGRFLAFAVEPVGAGWRDMEPSLEEAAADGASFLQAMRHVFVPVLWPALAAGATLVFAQSLAELTLSAILAGSGTETVGWLIFGLEQGGYASQSAALGTLLAVSLAAVMGGRTLVSPVAYPPGAREGAPVRTGALPDQTATCQAPSPRESRCRSARRLHRERPTRTRGRYALRILKRCGRIPGRGILQRG